MLKFTSFKFQVLVLLVSMLVLTTPVAAQGPGGSPLATPTAPPVMPLPWDDGTVPTPQEFLGWLALGAAPLIGALTSLLQRKSPWFQGLSTAGKWWVSFGLGAGLPALAGLLLLYVPEAFWVTITPVWTILGTALLGWLGKEMTFLLAVKPNQRTWLEVAGEEMETLT